MNLKDILVRLISFSRHRKFHFVLFICEQEHLWKMKPFFSIFSYLMSFVGCNVLLTFDAE